MYFCSVPLRLFAFMYSCSVLLCLFAFMHFCDVPLRLFAFMYFCGLLLPCSRLFAYSLNVLLNSSRLCTFCSEFWTLHFHASLSCTFSVFAFIYSYGILFLSSRCILLIINNSYKALYSNQSYSHCAVQLMIKKHN